MSTENVIAASNAAFPYDLVQLDPAIAGLSSYLIGYVDGTESATEAYATLPQQYYQVRREATTDPVTPDEYRTAAANADQYIANAISLATNTADATKCVRIVEHYQGVPGDSAQLRIRTSIEPTLAG